MKTAIVTGASGFIGRTLVNLLIKNNVKVYAVVRNKDSLNDIHDKVTIVEAECSKFSVIDKVVMENVDVFYHMVWEGGVYGAAFKDYELQLKNAKYTCDALALAIRLGCKKFVLPGTVNEYEAMDMIISEDKIPRYTNIYSSAKLVSRMMCKVIATQNNVEFCTGLVSKVYGEGDTSKTIINVVIKKLLLGESPDLVKGDNLYDFVYIDDVAEAFYNIGIMGKSNKAYYIGHRSINKFKVFINELSNIIAPNIKLNWGVYPDDADIDYNKIDLDALYNDTGFECKADFKESILKTAQWVKTLDF